MFCVIRFNHLEFSYVNCRDNQGLLACPVFDGTDYPYWKNNMRMHLEAIDVNLWHVVKNDVPKAGEGVTPVDVKKFIQLDSTAKNIICGHLTKGQYGRVSALKL